MQRCGPVQHDYVIYKGLFTVHFTLLTINGNYMCISLNGSVSIAIIGVVVLDRCTAIVPGVFLVVVVVSVVVLCSCPAVFVVGVVVVRQISSEKRSTPMGPNPLNCHLKMFIVQRLSLYSGTENLNRRALESAVGQAGKAFVWRKSCP